MNDEHQEREVMNINETASLHETIEEKTNHYCGFCILEWTLGRTEYTTAYLTALLLYTKETIQQISES